MLRNIMITCAGIVSLAAVGCQQPQTVLGSLPEPTTVAGGQRYAQADSRGVVYTNHSGILPRIVRPAFPRLLPVQPAVLGEPGWVPVIGTSDRWTCVVIHHSASDRAGPEAMDNAHRQRGWDELGYHFVIGNGIGYPDGKVYVGSRWAKQKHGAHCKVPGNYYNEHGIGICLMGNFEEHPPSEKQLQSLAQLVMFLQNQCGFGMDRVLTHGGVTGRTRCPGRYFSMNELYRRISGPMYAKK